jgi:hypothetical protein
MFTVAMIAANLMMAFVDGNPLWVGNLLLAGFLFGALTLPLRCRI